ncbi:RNase3 domain-containing protein [Diaporthe helianthi]|uniref:RNase3 domain-containing protein n=1 Tax=Diaporthe helianthi TaxID=158607 RepID=A0A2P5HUY9_DIAHE|nr:RNase3 domain-containing protein [Diaporthe helianthi]
MAHYSDSSGCSEDLGDAINDTLAAEDPLGSSWLEESESREAPAGEPKDLTSITARAYQVEMLEASLTENTIVAMDTGLGKTQVAVLRIRAELERMSSDKLIWFLAPTVSLCDQQFGVIKTQIPSVLAKIITGADNVESWSVSAWKAVLINVNLVVTTHQVLLDALLHGFVKISSLALLIFDEAHNCTKKHPGSRIMREFYQEAKNHRDPIPHILGLTASPVVRADISSLEELETTLDASCRSPTRHREELLAHTHRPLMLNIQYTPTLEVSKNQYTPSMSKIHKAYKALDIKEDPYIEWLSAQNTDRSERKLKDAFMKRDTYTQGTMKKLCKRSVDICRDMGSWAADWYIFEAIRCFLDGVKKQGVSSQSFKEAEVVYLARVFLNAGIGPPLEPQWEDMTLFSEKVRQLIDALLKYDGAIRGIVFVKERSSTAILMQILSRHPEISKRYRVGKMVGTSFIPGVKQDFLDLPERNNSLALQAFRHGRLDLLIVTAVLEEGIDVPACNLVICLEKPANLKSFIQRRGRARMEESHLYLFEETTDIGSKKEWGLLEAQMKMWYEDDLRELQVLKELEDSEVPDYPELRVESTGARLTINDAKSHINHFCATLTFRKFVDTSPDYLIEKVIQEDAQTSTQNFVKATVLLPSSLPPWLRKATSIRTWKSEANACKDAAFQAYQALYHANLVDEHLLPLREQDFGVEIPDRPGMTEAAAQCNPWPQVAEAWNQNNGGPQRHTLRLLDQTHTVKCEIELVLPISLPQMPPVTIHLDHKSNFILQIGEKVTACVESANDSVDVTSTLLSTAYAHRRLDIREEGYAVQLALHKGILPPKCSRTLFDANSAADAMSPGLVRDIYGNPFVFESLLSSKPAAESVQKVYKGFEEDPDDDQYMAVSKYPRGPGLFHQPPPPQQPPSKKPYSRVLPMSGMTIDDIPIVYAELGLLIPSLIHYIEIFLVATKLSETILKPLELSDPSMLVTAICASSARTPMNYERIEFLGDSVLKLCVTVNVASTNLRMPEGLLSRLKDRLVCNGRLCMAARTSGLDEFIIAKQFTLKGWSPPYIPDLLEAPDQGPQKRIISTKTLADVLEAVIGVSYIDGGLRKALRCVSFFLGEGQFRDVEIARGVLFESAEPEDMVLPAMYEPLEGLIGYFFTKKTLLVEAMTHPSYFPASYSYDRLEMIGDAILDHVIVQELFTEEPEALENWQMHLLRTALVNADILGFLVMEWSSKLSTNDVLEDGGGSEGNSGTRKRSPSLKPVENTTPLWSYMQYQSIELTIEREATAKRHAELRESILEAMHSGTHYPWALFARLHAPKFFSDLYESLVGAVWVDSGSFDKCKAFVERSGLLSYLARLRNNDTQVHVLHPKEELGRLANSETVSYVVREAEQDQTGAGRFGCKVLIGGKEVADVDGALFKHEAVVRAATEAVITLSTR